MESNQKSKNTKTAPVAPALIELVTEKGVAETLIEGGEALLDSVTSNEALQNIPFLGSLVGLVKCGLGIREYLFIKKLAGFLSSLSSVSDEDREEFRKRVLHDELLREKVGETILLLLERTDDMEKPDLLGKAFAAFLSKAIDLDQFKRMATAIDRCLIVDLMRLKEAKYDRIDESWGAHLVPADLVYIEVLQCIGGNRTLYPLTETGKLVKTHCLA